MRSANHANRRSHRPRRGRTAHRRAHRVRPCGVADADAGRCPRGGVENLSGDQAATAERLISERRAAQDAIRTADGQLLALREVEADEARIIAAQSVSVPTGAGLHVRDRDHGLGAGHHAARTALINAADGRQPWTREDGRPAALERAQRMADHPVAQGLIARDPAAHVTEMHSGLGSMVRSLSTTGASALVPQLWSSNVIDIARRQAQVINAGAETVPMDSLTLNIGRADSDPVSAWVAEGGTRTPSDPSYDLVTLTAKSMYAFTVASREFIMDAPNADQIIEEQLGKSMALQWDLTALFGGAITGVDGVAAAVLGAQASPPSPRGILGDLLANQPGNVLGNTTNGTVQVVAGYWREILQAYYLVKAQNESPSALIWPSKLAAQYNGLVDTLGQPLRRPDALAALPFLESQQIPANLTQGTGVNMTDFVVGDFRQVLLGTRLSTTLQVLSERYSELGQLGFKMEFRGDIRLARPKAMAWYRFIQGVA